MAIYNVCMCFCIRPIAHLPCPAKATLAVRCCPVYFELRTKTLEGESSPQQQIIGYSLFPNFKPLNLYSLICLSVRWIGAAAAQRIPAAISLGIRCGVWRFHLLLRHPADITIWLRVQYPLPHPEWPQLVRSKRVLIHHFIRIRKSAGTFWRGLSDT